MSIIGDHLTDNCMNTDKDEIARLRAERSATEMHTCPGCGLEFADEALMRLRTELAACKEENAALHEAADGNDSRFIDRMAKENLRLRKDVERIDWIEAEANHGKVEFAKSLLGKGFEVGQWHPIKATVTIGSLRAAIDAARREA